MKISDMQNRIRFLAGILAIVIVMMVGCGEAEQPEPATSAQGVEGIVTLTPGHNGERIGNQIDPTDRAPRPLPDATVYLISRNGNTGARTFVDSTFTDSTGYYRLTAGPGTYYVAVGTRTVAAQVLVSLPGDTTRLQRRIHAITGLNILKGRFIKQPLDITELSVE
jgi:hypothetical protein